MKKVLERASRPVFGLLCCAAAALLVSVLAVNRQWHGLVPMGFVLVIVLLASRFGTTVGVLGSILSALIFAWFLLAPVGSFRVSDPAERSDLAWMLLGGLTIPFLLLPPSRGVQSDEKPPKRAEVHTTGHE